MNRLGRKIARLIETSGPLSVADYMTICLFDPADGYYTTRNPFGAGGDFVTAPEVSQMFGELVGAWLVEAWDAIGRPLPVTLAEIGPGRGTMTKDVIRTVGKLAPDLRNGAAFALVEASPRLAAVQQETLRNSGPGISWHDSLQAVPGGPLLVAANELFDALPFRQFVRRQGQWLERAVGLDETGGLCFVTGTAVLERSSLPSDIESAPDGSVFEIAPARTALMDAIACRIARDGGAGIVFDYGHLEPGLGDTFQAVSRHGYARLFADPGGTDLTSHVDFSALETVVRSHGLQARSDTQGAFLLAMGLLERAGLLGAPLDEEGRAGIAADVERLAGPESMGKLFKVLAIMPPGVPVPGFPDAS